MTGMMKTEDPSFSSLDHYNSLSSAELSETKKVKLMYTSEFLKSFDRTPRQGSLLPLEDLEVENKKVRSKDQLDKLRERLEYKDSQILQLRTMVVLLKDLIMEKHDESSLKRLRDILNENEEGRHILISADVPNKAYKGVGLPPIPPLKLPESEFLDLPSISPISTASGGLSPTSQLSPHKLTNKSPRRKAQEPMLSPTAPLLSPSTLSLPSTPSPPAQPSSVLPPPMPGKSVPLKSPRRLPTTNKTTVISPPSASSIDTNNFNKNNAMKRSPSMPVITNERQKQEAATQAQLKLQKKTKSTEDATPEKNKRVLDDSSARKNKSVEATSPRKGIKKSVSMSSISAADDDDDKSDHSLATLKCTSLEEIVGQIYPLTKYQAGCRFLQKKLEEQPDSHHVTLVFNEVFDHLVELMTDPYGQYLVPKLMKYCDRGQRQAIVTKIAPKINQFACHTYGIHGVQKILEFLTDDQVNSFIDVIRPSVILLAKDAKGNYLIQSFLKQFPSEKNQFIYDAINENCVEVATHKVGCTLINRCVDYANEQQLNQLVGRVTSNCLGLVQDQFGNYVVQHLLATKAQFAPQIIKSLLGHIPELSTQKFSSNVIEKCLQVANAEQYADVIKEITDSNLLELLQDRYANFVIQTALDVADDQQHAKLVKLILPYIHQIKTPYVMHIQKKILQV